MPQKVVSTIDHRLSSVQARGKGGHYRFLVKAVTKSGSDPAPLVVEVSISNFDTISGGLRGIYAACNRVVLAQLPGYWIPKKQNWYLADLTHVESAPIESFMEEIAA